jgi:hypothetical protein
MPETTCPRCGHHFTPAHDDDVRPDLTVVRWLRDAAWSGEMSTEEVYADYLRACGDDAPVSRRRFVADLAYLGVPEVLDGETHVLVRE